MTIPARSCGNDSQALTDGLPQRDCHVNARLTQIGNQATQAPRGVGRPPVDRSGQPGDEQRWRTGSAPVGRAPEQASNQESWAGPEVDGVTPIKASRLSS